MLIINNYYPVKLTVRIPTINQTIIEVSEGRDPEKLIRQMERSKRVRVATGKSQ